MLKFNGVKKFRSIYTAIFFTFCDRFAGEDAGYWEDMSDENTAQAAEAVKLYALNNALSFPCSANGLKSWA